MTEIVDANNHYPVHASLVFRGKELDPQWVTKILDLVPHRSFKKGQKRKDGQEWPHGFWMYWSSDQIPGADLISHLEWLLEQIEPRKERVTDILRGQDIDAEISCFWIMPNSNDWLVLEPRMLQRVASLGIRVEFHICSPD